MCAAMYDITHHALEIHFDRSVDDYDQIRKQAAEDFAKAVKYKATLPSADKCQDIDAIGASLSEKSEQEVYSSALYYFMQALDPHSTFIPESQMEAMDKMDKNITKGIGIESTYVHSAIKLTIPMEKLLLDYVYPGTPASKYLQIGDEIEEINGTPINGRLYDEIVDLLNEEDEQVSIKIKRTAEPIPFTLQEIKKPAVYERPTTMDGQNMVYIRITRFVEGVSEQMGSILRRPEVSKASGVILDLRGNPGGLVIEGLGVLDKLLTQSGEAFHTKGSHKNNLKVFDSYKVSGKPLYRGKLIVLVDSDTASTSEIVAGAIYAQSRGLIIGEGSYGKGSIQRSERNSPLNGFGGTLLTTTSLVYFNHENTHQLSGVIPHHILQDSRMVEAKRIMVEKNIDKSFYERDYTNAIKPFGGPLQISDQSLLSIFGQSFEEPQICDDLPDESCVESHAVRILETVINRSPL